VRLVDAAGAAVEVPARHHAVADGESRLVAEPSSTAPPRDPPTVVGFSLIEADKPRRPLPGWERLQDGAVIDLARLPTRRINLQAHTAPERTGSVRFAVGANPNFNTELVMPYTLLPLRAPPWSPRPGRYAITATPFTGTYANGARGAAATITVTVVDGDGR
jgi:hypothetical protein